MRDKIDRLERFVNRISDARLSDRNINSESLLDADKDRENAVEQLAPLIGNLKLSDTGGTNYVSPAHWESIIEDVSVQYLARCELSC